MNNNGWTEQRRKRQSELIKKWKPWKQSTGAKTKQGKNMVARNAYKGAARPTLRKLAKLLKKQQKLIDGL